MHFAIDRQTVFVDSFVRTVDTGVRMSSAESNDISTTQAAPAWSPGLRAGIGVWLGFTLLALTHAILFAILVPRPATGIGVRLQHHLFDAAGTLGVGFFTALIVGTTVTLIDRRTAVVRRARLYRLFGFVAYTMVTASIMRRLLEYELERTALNHLGGNFYQSIIIVGTLLLGLSVPTLFLLGWWSTRRRFAQVAIFLIALAAMIGNHFFLRDDYTSVHGALAWLSTTLAAMPLGSWAERLLAKRPQRWKTVGLGFVVFGLLGLVVPPSSTVRAEMFREPGAVSAWILATLRWSLPAESSSPLLPEFAASPYFQSRERLSGIPPTQPRLLQNKAPIVVLVTIDATRADAIEREKNEQFFPTLTRLKRDSAYFAHVTSTGSQTAVALSSLFSGKYFSQLEWRNHGMGSMQFLYPANDRSPRFPELLSSRGIITATWPSITFLSNEYGIIRGFAEEKMVTQGREHAPAKDVVKPLLERLERAGNEPLFLYVHLTEPHFPYDRGGTEGPPIQRYLREIGIADEYLGQIVKLLSERFADRGYLFISSDHGEAFGEHGTTKHTKTLYEELLRVPLFVYGPGIRARRIDEHVTNLDIGPTILDLFGVDTPGSFMGQSLVPLLAGRDVRLDRPIVAEGRLRRVLYWGDLKVIDDPRRKVVEVFDLQQDPRELRNLFDTQRERVLPAVAALRRFFDVHRIRRDGYEIPYKP